MIRADSESLLLFPIGYPCCRHVSSVEFADIDGLQLVGFADELEVYVWLIASLVLEPNRPLDRSHG